MMLHRAPHLVGGHRVRNSVEIAFGVLFLVGGTFSLLYAYRNGEEFDGGSRCLLMRTAPGTRSSVARQAWGLGELPDGAAGGRLASVAGSASTA